MIGFGSDADRFVTVGVLFEATSFGSSASGSQNKDRSETGFGCRNTGDMTIFVGDMI